MLEFFGVTSLPALVGIILALVDVVTHLKVSNGS